MSTFINRWEKKQKKNQAFRIMTKSITFRRSYRHISNFPLVQIALPTAVRTAPTCQQPLVVIFQFCSWLYLPQIMRGQTTSAHIIGGPVCGTSHKWWRKKRYLIRRKYLFRTLLHYESPHQIPLPGQETWTNFDARLLIVQRRKRGRGWLLAGWEYRISTEKIALVGLKSDPDIDNGMKDTTSRLRRVMFIYMNVEYQMSTLPVKGYRYSRTSRAGTAADSSRHAVCFMYKW